MILYLNILSSHGYSIKKRKEDKISGDQKEPRPCHEDEMIPFCNPLGSSRSIPRLFLRPPTVRIIKDITPSLTRATTIRHDTRT